MTSAGRPTSPPSVPSGAVCIAGAMRIGARVASAVQVRRSSAIPCASLAMTFAVAGAITRVSAISASETCSIENGLERSNISMATGCPVRARNVAGVTSFEALSVITVCTETPACVRRLARSAAL